jgi:peptide/nickel transport system substrate-binding protein
MVHATYGIVSSRGDPATAPLCTGPYRVASYKPHEQLTVVRNERYRGPPPRTDTVTFRFLPDESTRVLALKAGDVDMISDYGSRGGGASPAGFELIAAPPGAVLMIYINRNGSAPYNQMADQKLRRAVAHSLDRSALVTRIMPPGDVPATTVGPSSVLGQWAGLVKGVPYDTVEARRLAGTRVRPLTLIYNVNVVDKAVAEFVQASLRTVGIPLRVEGLDAASFDSRINAGTFDIDLEIPNQNDANPAFLLALRWYSKSGVPSAKFTHASPAYDGIIEEALLAADLESVRHAAARAAHQLVDVEAGAIPLAGISRRWLLSPYVSGFEPHPARLYQRWSTISVQK